MSSHPRESPASATAPASGATALLVANRRPAAWVLLALALVSFVGGAYLLAKTFRPAAKPAEGETELGKLASERADEVLKLGNSEYLLGGFGALALSAVLAGGGVVSLSALPKPTLPQQEADARRWLVLFGGLTGLTLMLIGFAFSVEWYRYLSEWLDTKSPPPGTYRFVLALLVFVIGAGLAFLSAQPARADERDDPLVRRLIFGMNLGLSTFLLLVLLVVANIFVTLKVPNRLDTTATSLNSIELSEPTAEYITGLTTPVTVYTTATDEEFETRMGTRYPGSAIHRLLDACRERNPSFFAVKYLSRSLNKDKLAELRNRYPAADFAGDDGLLVTVGRDEEQHSYIKSDGLMSRPEGRGGPAREEFVGESRLLRELLFLSDNKTPSVVYFTVGHGELDVLPPDPGAAPAGGPRRPANTLRATLEKNSVELKPLRFDLARPAVPPDAAIVVIADPTGPFSPAEADALKAYLKATNAAGRAGKLILLAGAYPTPDRRGVVDVGLDGVLTDYGVTLGHRHVLNTPARDLSARDTLAVVADLADKENPLVREFGGTERAGFILPRAQEVIVSASAKPAGKAEAFLATYPGRVTWLETELPDSPVKAYNQMVQDPELIAAKQAERGGRRSLGALVSENDKGKLAVIGSGAAFSDDRRENPQGAEGGAQLLSVTVNWLREQPAVANVAAKTYGYYTPERRIDPLRAGLLPVLMATLLTAALGAGVWIVRRK